MYPRDYRHEDDNSCPHCGVDMEVIGPPGPRHRGDCPHNDSLTDDSAEVTDEDVKAMLAALRRLRWLEGR